MNKDMIKKMELLTDLEYSVLRSMAAEFNISKFRAFEIMETNSKFKSMFNFLKEKAEQKQESRTKA